jgi:hydroxyacylglutathione hydrolase
MLDRKPVFPHVIEVNHQLGRMIGCNVYLLYDRDEWLIMDVGYDEDVEEILDLIRDLDFPYSRCKMLIATHPDIDHAQGLAKAKKTLRTQLVAHPDATEILASGDQIQTMAEIKAQNISMEMPAVQVDGTLNDGDRITVGDLELEVWWTPGHTPNQLSFRMGNLLFCGDNIYRDGCVGAIVAHHGSDLPAFIKSLTRIRDADVEWLLPSHGPIFRHDPKLLDSTIERLKGYQRMADFGTCATEWPLIDQWEQELLDGKMPG